MVSPTDYGNLAAFFSVLDPRDAAGFAKACSVQLVWAQAELRALDQRMRDCPRGDKAQAVAINAARTAVNRHIKDLKARRRPAEETLDRQDRHGLWVAAVRAVCGDEALAKVQAHMKRERAIRKAAA